MPSGPPWKILENLFFGFLRPEDGPGAFLRCVVPRPPFLDGEELPPRPVPLREELVVRSGFLVGLPASCPAFLRVDPAPRPVLLEGRES